jgi:hypothetical protein
LVPCFGFRASRLGFLLFGLLFSLAAAAGSPDSVPRTPHIELPLIAPASGVKARDNPNDDGGKILLNWSLSLDDSLLDGYRIERQAKDSAEFEKVGYVGKGIRTYVDDQADDKLEYRYRIAAVGRDDSAASQPSGLVRSSPQWFHAGRVNVLVAGLLFSFLVLFFTMQARRGKKLFIRRISGLDAVDEALGRATEMGRPILFIPGLSTMDDVATIAALNILGEVAKKTAHYGTPLVVPNRDPIVYTVAREVVKEAYTQAGRPDVFNQDLVYFITDNQFAYAAAVDGYMVRERPATNFLMGYFWAESLILAETGASIGAIQIAGTDSVTQLPFFVTACDYTLLGEELYAASAYLSREPLLMGAIKGQDYGKAIIVILLLVLTVLALTTRWPVTRLFGQ